MAYRGRRDTSTVTLPNRVRSDGRIVAPDPEESLRARVGKNSAYDKYKEQLNELFDGKRELPKQFQDMLAGAPGAEQHGFDHEPAPPPEQADKKTKSRRSKKNVNNGAEKGTRRRVGSAGVTRAAHIKALRAAHSPREIEKSIDAMREAGFGLPKEFDLLSKALGHSDEQVQADVLGEIIAAAKEAAVKSPNLLKGRVENVALLATTSEVRELCTELQEVLAAQ